MTANQIEGMTRHANTVAMMNVCVRKERRRPGIRVRRVWPQRLLCTVSHLHGLGSTLLTQKNGEFQPATFALQHGKYELKKTLH